MFGKFVVLVCWMQFEFQTATIISVILTLVAIPQQNGILNLKFNKEIGSMIMNITKSMILSILVFFLFGCQADEIEISMVVNEIPDIVSGTNSVAKFEATFSGIGELDDEKNHEIDQLKIILEKYVVFDDFEISSDDFRFEISIEGEITITNDASYRDAFYLHIQPSNIFDGYYQVQFKTGKNFSLMESKMKRINFMMSPDEFHPIKFKIKGEDYQVIALGAMIQGRPYLIYKNDHVQNTIRISMKDGIYKKVGAAIFLKSRN